jgi:hypothetical protein
MNTHTVSFVLKDVVVTTMTVHQWLLKVLVDTEVVDLYQHLMQESLERGNIQERHNGSKFILKRFGRLKKSTYLCQTNKN